MAKTTVIRLTTDNDILYGSITAREVALRLSEQLQRMASGNPGGTMGVALNCTADVKASGTYTLSSSSGTLTATINGIAITASGAGTDAEDATALAAAINASSNALVAGIVTASAAGAVVTVTAVQPGKIGNSITTTGSGTGVTCNQTRLASGAGGDVAVSSYTL
jgi:phage tail sheath gpL-like